MICHSKGSRLNTGPMAKPRAGSVKAAAARPPSPWTVTFMNRRRVTVSPSNAPGMFRSTVYFDRFSLCLSDTDKRDVQRRRIQQGREAYRQHRDVRHEGAARA